MMDAKGSIWTCSSVVEYYIGNIEMTVRFCPCPPKFMRTFFNYPVSQETTEQLYPNKMTIEEFRKLLLDSIDPHMNNMIHLGGKNSEDKYFEEWLEQYLYWLDIDIDIERGN